MRQNCVSCDIEVCKLKNGQEYKTRCEHYTPEDVNDYTSIDSPAMCGACVRAKKRGYKKFLKGKHFSSSGELILTQKQKIEKHGFEIKKLEADQANIQSELNIKRQTLEKILVKEGKNVRKR